MKNFRKVFPRLLFSLMLLFSLQALGQEEQKMTKKQKKAHEKKEEQKQDARKAEIEGRKHHLKLQDKATRKRMKKNRKKGSGYVSSKPRFIDRILAPFR
jgi:hypothetical protein